MKAMILEAAGGSLKLVDRPVPKPGEGQVLIRVLACGVCRTDLHILDGELAAPHYPIVPGHEIVGEVVEQGPGVAAPPVGSRVGVPWLGHSCGHCPYCRAESENLCDTPLFTGYQIAGGYAEYTVAEAAYCFALPATYGDVEAAPLLCAGLIGYRSYRFAGDGRHLGLYGFGAAAHILAQVACHQGREIYAFTRPGDVTAQDFARSLGARWAGGSNECPPRLLDAAILFAPLGDLVPAALGAVRKGGIVVCGGIHMSDIPSFPYALLWEERRLQSVANLTRRDGHEFLALAGKVKIRTDTHPYPLADANQVLDDLRHGRFTGTAVLVP